MFRSGTKFDQEKIFNFFLLFYFYFKEKTGRPTPFSMTLAIGYLSHKYCLTLLSATTIIITIVTVVLFLSLFFSFLTPSLP